MSHMHVPTVPRSDCVRCTRCGELTSILQLAAGMASPCRGPVTDASALEVTAVQRAAYHRRTAPQRGPVRP